MTELDALKVMYAAVGPAYPYGTGFTVGQTRIPGDLMRDMAAKGFVYRGYAGIRRATEYYWLTKVGERKVLSHEGQSAPAYTG